MKLVKDQEWLRNLRFATNNAFGAAFFFLPVSKPLLYFSLLAALLLFIASGDFVQAVRNWHNLPWIAPAIILVLLPLLSSLIHGNGDLQFANLQLSYYWLFAFLVFLAASQMHIVPWVHAFLGGVFLVLCYTQLAARGWWPFKHTPSASANYILYSQFLAAALVLISVLYKHADSQRKKLVYLTCMGLFFFGVASGNGRTGLLIVIILLPCIFLNVFRKQNISKVILACLVAFLVLAMFPAVQTRINHAVQDVTLFRKDVTETSLGYRFEMWETAWEVFCKNPVFGASPTGFRMAWVNKVSEDRAKEFREPEFREPHNAFLFYASSYGVIGLTSLIWLYLALLWTGWRQRHSLEGGIVFTFAAIVVLSSFTNTIFIGAVSLAWLMLFIGLQGSLLHSLSVNKLCKEQ